ncbi:MAG: PTS sugar transporter subunit IIA [Mycoplasmatales bacterium]|nr:PTS sugar transporter subunit IIA [Mycoplasmatales bacterium]
MKIKVLNLTCKTRNEVLTAITKDAVENKFASSKAKLLKAFQDREKTGTTGFEDGVAIPHARIPEIKETVVYVARFPKGVEWPALDGGKTTVAIGLLVPGGDEAGNNHMELLSLIATKLMDKDFRELVKSGTKTNITKAINSKDEEKPKEKVSKTNSGLKIVGVSACATGVAHTYMAQKAMQDEGAKLGHSVKVETQGQKGQENVLTEQEIAEADYVIIAADINVELDRFNGKKVILTTTKDAMHNFAKIISRAPREAKKLKLGANGNVMNATGRGALSHILSGVSRMIPFVVFSGIVWAILNSITFAYKGAMPAELELASKAAAVGFTFFIAMMGGFIGESVGGRAAFAPAAIATFVAANPDFYYDWNGVIPPVFMKDLSGNILKDAAGKSIQLKVGWTIIGAIVCGFSAGFLVKQVNKIKVHSLIAPLVPILFIPVVITSLLVFPIVFVLGAPIGWLVNMLGLGIGLGGQVPGVNFLIGFILGAMIGWDMGGPINKIAGSTATALIIVDPRLLGAVEAAIPIAPLGCGLATLIGGKTFDKTEKGLGISALALGFFGISEGAIPFAAKRPKQTIFVNTLSSAIAGGLAFTFFVGGHVGMWGGPIVALVLGVYADPGTLGTHIPVIFGGNVPFLSILWFFVAIIAATVMHAFLYIYFVKRDQKGKKMFPSFKSLKVKKG